MPNQADPRKTKLSLWIWTDVYDAYLKRARIEKTNYTDLMRRTIYAKVTQDDLNLAAAISTLELEPSPARRQKYERPQRKKEASRTPKFEQLGRSPEQAAL